MTSPHTFWEPEPEWVSAEVIQQMFNDMQLLEKGHRSELKIRVLYGQRLTNRQCRKLNEPRDTRSQIVLYTTLDDQPIALVHQYRRRSGELGASGRPDPKRLFAGGRVFAVKQSLD